MVNPHVHVPYHKIGEHLSFLKANHINLEIYFSSYSLDTIQESDIKKLIERLEYKPSISIHAPFMDLSPGAVDSKVREVTNERFLQVIKIAEILKPEVLVFHSGYEKWKYAWDVEIWLEGSLKTWRPLLRKAVGLGSKIAIENIFEDEPVNLRRLMEEINSEHFGICFDTGHFNLFSKSSLDIWLQHLKPYIIELHLHDNNRTFDDHLAIGEGSFDFEFLFSALYDKDVIHTIETHSVEGVMKSIMQLRKYV